MKATPVTLKNVTRPLARDLLQVASWVLSMITLVAAIAYPRALAFGAEASFSIWAFFMAHAASWWLFGMAIYFVSECLRPYVAMGVTRRRFVMAAAVTLAAAALGLGLYASLGFLVEGWWYQRVGWEQNIAGDRFTQQPGAAFLLGLEVILRSALLGLSGLLVGWSYQKFSGWFASFLLLFTVGVPLTLVTVFLDDTEGLQRIGIDMSGWGQLASILILLLAAFALYLLTRELLSRTALKARVP